jgi:hypothetical protein
MIPILYKKQQQDVKNAQIESGQIWERTTVVLPAKCLHMSINVVALGKHNNTVSSTCEDCNEWLVHSTQHFIANYRLTSRSGKIRTKVCVCDMQSLMISGCHCGAIKRYGK